MTFYSGISYPFIIYIVIFISLEKKFINNNIWLLVLKICNMYLIIPWILKSENIYMYIFSLIIQKEFIRKFERELLHRNAAWIMILWRAVYKLCMCIHGLYLKTYLELTWTSLQGKIQHISAGWRCLFPATNSLGAIRCLFQRLGRC